MRLKISPVNKFVRNIPILPRLERFLMQRQHLRPMSNPQHHLPHHNKVAKVAEQAKEPTAYSGELSSYADDEPSMPLVKRIQHDGTANGTALPDFIGANQEHHPFNLFVVPSHLVLPGAVSQLRPKSQNHTSYRSVRRYTVEIVPSRRTRGQSKRSMR